MDRSCVILSKVAYGLACCFFGFSPQHIVGSPAQGCRTQIWLSDKFRPTQISAACLAGSVCGSPAQQSSVDPTEKVKSELQTAFWQRCCGHLSVHHVASSMNYEQFLRPSVSQSSHAVLC